MDDSAAFARLIHALRPWLAHLVIVGGWAHRLYRLHPLAGAPAYAPLRTRDVDLALSPRAPVAGDIRKALEDARFKIGMRRTQFWRAHSSQPSTASPGSSERRNAVHRKGVPTVIGLSPLHLDERPRGRRLGDEREEKD